MEMSRITLKNILFVLLLGALAAISGIHAAKKESKKNVIVAENTIVIPPE